MCDAWHLWGWGWGDSGHSEPGVLFSNSVVPGGLPGGGVQDEGPVGGECSGEARAGPWDSSPRDGMSRPLQTASFMSLKEFVGVFLAFPSLWKSRHLS